MKTENMLIKDRLMDEVKVEYESKGKISGRAPGRDEKIKILEKE